MMVNRFDGIGIALDESVRSVCEGKRIGIAFSGGMDSGLLAALASKYANRSRATLAVLEIRSMSPQERNSLENSDFPGCTAGSERTTSKIPSEN